MPLGRGSVKGCLVGTHVEKRVSMIRKGIQASYTHYHHDMQVGAQRVHQHNLHPS